MSLDACHVFINNARVTIKHLVYRADQFLHFLYICHIKKTYNFELGVNITLKASELRLTL